MQKILSDFLTALSGVRSVLSDLDAQALANALDLPANRRRETIRGAMTVVMSGYFEEFLRFTAREFVTQIGTKSRKFSELPEKMRKAHLEIGGRLVTEKSRNRVTWITASASDLALRLGDAISNPATIPLWEAFADTKGNPKAKVVLEFMHSLGITNPKAKIDIASGSPRWSDIELHLDLFIESRNQCAHTGSVSTVPTTKTISKYCDTLEELATLMIRVLDDQLLII